MDTIMQKTTAKIDTRKDGHTAYIRIRTKLKITTEDASDE